MQNLLIILVLLLMFYTVLFARILYAEQRNKVVFTIKTNGLIYILKGENLMTSATIDNTVTISALITDKKGNAVTPVVSPIWAIDNAAVATIAAAADGLSAVVTPVGPAGTVVVTVSDGTLTATTSIDFTAGAPAAISLTEVVNAAA